MLISLTGIDGAGKSHIAKLLYKEIKKTNKKCVLINKWEIFDDNLFSECRFINKDLNDLRDCISEMEGRNRFIFLMWLIYISLEKKYIEDSDTIYILDGYWIKHAAFEIIYGVEEDWILSVVKKLPKPDYTIYLDIDPDISFSRKKEYTKYECGRLEISKENFINHQSKLRFLLKNWSILYGWHTILSTEPGEQIVEEIIRKVGI